MVWFHQSRWWCLDSAWCATFWIAGLEYIILNISGLWICHLSTLSLLQPPVFPQHHLFSSSGQYLAFSALQFLLQKDLLHTVSLSSNSSVTQGLGSSGFTEQRWQELLSFRWKLGGCSQSSKMLVSQFVVWQPRGRRCSTLPAEPSSGRRISPQVKGWVLPSDIGVGTRDRWAVFFGVGRKVQWRQLQRTQSSILIQIPNLFSSAFAGYHLRKRKNLRIHCIPTPRPPHGNRSAGI